MVVEFATPIFGTKIIVAVAFNQVNAICQFVTCGCMYEAAVFKWLHDYVLDGVWQLIIAISIYLHL